MTTRRKTNTYLPTLLATGLLAFTSHVNAITLEYSEHEPYGNMRTQLVQNQFFNTLQKESHGRIKINAHYNGELASPYTALNAVATGKSDKGDKAVDIAMLVPEYAEKQLPLHQLFKSFPVGVTGQRQVNFLRTSYATIPELTDELHRNNIEPLLIVGGYPVGFFGKQPLHHLNDLQGQNWRSASFWHRDFLNNTGAKGVTTKWGEETLQALDKGTLAGLMVNIDSAKDLKIHELAPNALVSQKLWLGHVYIVGMNKTKYDALSTADKQAIQRSAQKTYANMGATMDKAYQAMLTTLRQENTTITQIPDSELMAWQNNTRYTQLQDNWINQQQSNGIQGVKSVLVKLRDLLSFYQQK